MILEGLIFQLFICLFNIVFFITLIKLCDKVKISKTQMLLFICLYIILYVCMGFIFFIFYFNIIFKFILCVEIVVTTILLFIILNGMTE